VCCGPDGGNLVCCGSAGHAPGLADRESTEAGRADGGPESQPAGGARLWAEQSDMSLYHSAHGSFGMSSTASSSVFVSAMHMDRSMARSKVQQAPLAEEGEVEDSDADSFFSASDDGQEPEGECRSVNCAVRSRASCPPAALPWRGR